MALVKKVSIVGLYNDNKEILLQERGAYSKNGEKWAFFGGHLEEGETSLEAFHREANEELGLDMTKFNYTYLGEVVSDFGDRIIYSHIYVVKTDLKEEEFEIYEGESGKYFSLNEARELFYPTPIANTLDVIEKYFQNIF